VVLHVIYGHRSLFSWILTARTSRLVPSSSDYIIWNQVHGVTSHSPRTRSSAPKRTVTSSLKPVLKHSHKSNRSKIRDGTYNIFRLRNRYFKLQPSSLSSWTNWVTCVLRISVI
jgi:hypothetical protein